MRSSFSLWESCYKRWTNNCVAALKFAWIFRFENSRAVAFVGVGDTHRNVSRTKKRKTRLREYEDHLFVVCLWGQGNRSYPTLQLTAKDEREKSVNFLHEQH